MATTRDLTKLGGFQRRLLTLGMLLVSLSLSLLGAEIAVRWIFRDVSTTGDSTSYFSRRWRDRCPPRSNHAGFREREFDPQPADGVYRIAVIGDSIAYGPGIAEEDRFSNRLERRLNALAGGATYEVLNFAQSGADTVDHIEFLRKYVVPSHPRMVILQWFVNDAENGDISGRPKFARLIPSSRVSRWLYQSSALYFLVRRQWEQSQGFLGLGSDYTYTEYMTRRFAGKSNMDGRHADEAVREFIRITRENQFSIGVVLFPQLSEDLGEEYPLNFLLDRVQAVCTSEGVDCVDLRTIFAAVRPVSRLWVNRFDAHPGPVAHELATESLLAEYSALWLQESHRR